jgi:uncharacterized protein DUF4190/uncharacterized protein DUF4339
MYTIVGADGREYGPVAADQIRQWIAEGRANAQTRVRTEGAADWKLLAELPEFAANLFTVAPAPAAFPVTTLPRNNPLAVTGLVLGILSLVGCCCYGLPFNIAGIIFSGVALSQISKDPLNQRGKGMAVAGLALSILSVLLAILVFSLGLASNWTDVWRKLQRL